MTEATLNRVALVTGAGSGVGRASALALLREGWTVVLTGRRMERLEETRQMAGDDAVRTLAVVCDVSDADAIASLFERVREEYGRLDLLFNNAGSGAPAVPLEELTLEQWQRVVDLNLTGAFLCTQEAFRIMKDQDPRGGRIINNGSISADRPRPNSSPYTATKHALTGLTKSTALDGRKYDIACGQIDIGNALTEMTAGMGRGVPQPSGERMVEPTFDVEHVADAIVYNGQPAARRQRAVYHGDGHEDAALRPRLAHRSVHRLVHHQAAIDVERLARDVASTGSGQEPRHVCDVLGGIGSADRDSGGTLSLENRRDSRRCVRLDCACSSGTVQCRSRRDRSH